ncbi:MAG: hypothetical protein H6708_03765 [Kofleriaceae bacterium]|nr:hypothetical protein [Kofleriaceae bacterium]
MTAARAGNCALVETLGDRVRKLDATWYASGFAKQPDIVACRAKRN